MCSIGEDDFGDDGGEHSMAHEPNQCEIKNIIGLCKKCGKEGTIYKLRARHAECEDCFLNYVNHKFRATLGASKILPRAAKILITFDGSIGAITLADMVHHAYSLKTFKRLNCYPTLLFIDDKALAQPYKDLSERREHLLMIKEYLSAYKSFEIYALPYGNEQLKPFDLKTDMEPYLQYAIELETNLIKCLNVMRSLTTRQDYLRLHRLRLIASAAKHLNCEFALLPDTSTTLAADLMAAMALGRGCNAALDVSLVDDRFSMDVKLLRPIKELNDEEIEFYLRARQLQPLKVECYGDAQGNRASLQNLMKFSIDNWNKNYPATVSAIYRCGEKLAPSRASDTQTAECVLCSSPLGTESSTTLKAIEFSRLVSAQGVEVKDIASLDRLTNLNLHNDDKLAYLCYACRNIELQMGILKR